MSDDTPRWTVIRDHNGTRMVQAPFKKRRKRSQPRRFADLKVGDWLEGGTWQKFTAALSRGLPVLVHSLVTDQWFDPVAGEADEEKGRLFAVAPLVGVRDGEPAFGRKTAHTRIGLARNGYAYSRVSDPAAEMIARQAGIADGHVAEIWRERKLRERRPKIPGRTL